MPEFNYAKGRITDSLQFITTEIKEFEQDYIFKSWKDYKKDRKLQKLMDRTVENIFTALIEICGTILSQEGISAESYAQVLGKCAQRLGFSEEEQETLAKIAIQRNRLAHRYLNFRWQAINMFIENKSLILKLLTKISENPE
ncbi:MAG: HepT-like ribonuclease domain-containing protein [Candidatus Caldatribacteriota bacterium]|nr:HepT-like ribonuclease domain-containing protein [Candidatus Caldatribacteriota bacterium]